MDPYPPISDYALLSDCHSAALVSRDGSVDWCCFHRFDAHPVFARLLDWSKGGHFRIAPVADYQVTRRYLPGTNVLETTFQTASGSLALTDCLPVRREATGAQSSYHQLIRLARCERGEVEVELDFSPRFEFGYAVPRVTMAPNGLGIVYGGPGALTLQSDLRFEPTVHGSRGTKVLRAGQEAVTLVTQRQAHQAEVEPLLGAEIRRRLDETTRFWRDWSDRCQYQGPYREQVVRSALVLKALVDASTGALVAAPTTSLPEKLGGVRNWDYRYTWLRDAAINLYSLFRLGYTEEAHAFMGWLQRTTAGRVDDLQVAYGVEGEHLLPEVKLGELEGYRHSRPVRVGNAAARQFQVDVFGYLLDTAWLYHRHGGTIDEEFWDFLTQAIDKVADCWSEPDHGIWEVRGRPQHFVSSKVFAWVAVDRAVRLAEALDLPADLDRWKWLRRRIRHRVESDGLHPETGAFRRAFGSDKVDASNLLIPLVRFLPADDPRVHATWRRIEGELSRDGLVYRYLAEDGLPPGEATFLICSFWLVDNLALAGELDRAKELFECLCGFANDVGLLAEQVEAGSGELRGNFPQAFSHMGLIGAAINLARASGRPTR